MGNLPLLLRIATTIRPIHLKLFVGLLVCLALASTAVVGDLAWGSRGAVAAPLIALVVGVIGLHIFVRLAIALGLRAHARGQHIRAFSTLWLTQLRFFRAYDRKGKVSGAFAQSKALMMTSLLQAQMKKMMQGPR